MTAPEGAGRTESEALAEIRKYADERAWYGRRNRTVDSARIASDLLAILNSVQSSEAQQ